MKKAPSFDIRRNVGDDAPMEDSLGANRAKYQKGLTDAEGNFSIAKVADGRSYVYAEPSGTTYLPGDDLSNTSMTTAELSAEPLEISLSGSILSNATFLGSTRAWTATRSRAPSPSPPTSWASRGWASRASCRTCRSSRASTTG